jgi:crossover junction endodeoxyribonuclease RuvC
VWRWSSLECGISVTEPSTPQRILGIDPGLRLTGFGLIDVQGAHRISYVASGVIRIPDGELATRLATIFNQLQDVIAQYRPQAAAVEKVFVNVNPASTLLLGHARGAALCALSVAGLPVAEYTALQIKQAVVGYGRASKEQVQAMMVRLLALPGAPSQDAADALACATCHAHAARMTQSLLAAGAVPARSRQGARLRRGRLINP